MLPISIAKELPNVDELCIRRINAPSASQQMSLCIPDSAALFDAAFAVVIVPKENIADVCVKSAAREEKEAGIMKALKAGGDILELSGIGKVLESKGCTSA